MKRKRQSVVLCLVSLVMVAGFAGVVQAQAPAAEVTKEHEVLKKDVGVWDAEMKLWMEGPDSEPMVSKGMERNRLLGGFWVLSDFTADMDGEQFKGHGQFGYNVQKKKYVGTWVDSMSSHMSTGVGDYDESTGVMTMIMTGIDPATGKEYKSKSVSKYVDEDTRNFEMFMPDPAGGDKWVKSMEIKYKRRAGAAKKRAR